jgi:MFS family permease
VLGGSAQELGVLMGASGLGALISGIHLASRTGSQGLERFVTRGAAVFGGALVVFTYSTSLPLSVAALVVAGYAMMTSATACNTIVQLVVEDAMRGRVMSLILMAFMGLMPLGALVVGWLADRTGAPFALRMGAAACVFGGILFGRRLEAAFALPGAKPA